VFLASRNPKKLLEMRRILAEALSDSGGPGIEVLGLDDVAPYDEPVEDQPSFAQSSSPPHRSRPGRSSGSPTTARRWSPP